MNSEALNPCGLACDIYDLGCIEYLQAYEKQQQALRQVLQSHRNILLFCEHPPTFTLGRLDKNDNFLIPIKDITKKGIPVLKIDRGGQITFHGPGQLVVYPIFDLHFLKGDLRFFITQIEQVVIDFLKEFDIVAGRLSGATGVWINDKKIASIGIGVRQWVSYHGLAINVNTNLDYFQMIRPCGLNAQMTSVAQQLGKSIDEKCAKIKMISCFQEVFGFQYNGGKR